MKALDVLVGDWSMAAKPPDAEPWPGGGTISFAWLNDAWLIQRWEIDLPEAPDGIAVLGPKDAPASGEDSAESGELVQHYFDSRGVHRVYEMSFEGRTWKLWREGEPFDQRMTAEVSEDGRSIAGRWERVEKGEWIVDFDLTYTRVE